VSKVLITGGAGFVGSHLAERLLREGCEVHIIDDLSNGKIEFIPRGCVTLFNDFADQTVLRYIAQSQFDTVFHLAARPRVLYSVEYPAETNDENVSKTVRLLEACRNNIERFIFTSSSSVYGGTDQLPTPENTPRNPKSPYALQKAIGEDYCVMFSDLYNMDTVSIRPFNLFGPRQLANGVYGTVVSSWIHALKYNGELRSDGDGTQIRDMTHISNAVDVFMRVAAYKGKLRGEAINAGTGTTVSNNQIMAWLLQRHPEARDRVVTAPWRLGDVRATQADISVLQKQLGYSNLVDFWTGLKETYDWAMNSEIF
jgi:nucleoside-diphosphate-sugar epimerase